MDIMIKGECCRPKELLLNYEVTEIDKLINKSLSAMETLTSDRPLKKESETIFDFCQRSMEKMSDADTIVEFLKKCDL